MIIKIRGASYTYSIGTLNSYYVNTSGTGFDFTGDRSISKDSLPDSYTGTITTKTDYVLTSVVVKVGGTTVSSLGATYTVESNTTTHTVTIPKANLTGDITIVVGTSYVGTGTPETTYYTITYQYMCNGTSIKTATTEQVTAGTTKTFSTSGAPVITGYTISGVSPTSATVTGNTTVTYTYTANGGAGGNEMEAGTYTYSNSGYVLATTGKVTTGNTWIHSDFIPVSQLANGDDGKCVRTFTGHGTVAAMAFYTTKDNFDSFVSSVKTGDIEGGATSVTAEYVKGLAPTGSNYVVFSTDGSKQTLSVTVGNGSGGGSSEPEEPDTPTTSGINYYDEPGFISISTGQVTNTTSDWIHSDFIAIDSLVDDAELGHCIGKCTGHASVADIAFYSAANFSSFIIGKSSAGATKTVAALQTLMAELNATNATHIIISTDKTKNQLYASLK